jgi:hypothetical protein
VVSPALLAPGARLDRGASQHHPIYGPLEFQMAEIQYNTTFKQSDMDPYFIGIGRVSMAAAHLDMMVSHSIWRLANAAQWAGACITSQITAPIPKFRALTALLQMREGKPEHMKALNSISVEVDSCARQRNRLIHDPAFIDPKTRDTVRFQATADRKLEFGMVASPLSEIVELHDKIVALTVKFYDLMEEAFAALPPFDDTEFQQSGGIRPDRPKVRERSPGEPGPPPEPSGR